MAGQLSETRYAEGEAAAEGGGHHDETGEDMGTRTHSERIERLEGQVQRLWSELKAKDDSLTAQAVLWAEEQEAHNATKASLEAAEANVRRLTSELDKMDRRRRTCRAGASYLAELNGELTEEVGRLKAEVEALKASPMTWFIGADYGDTEGAVVELIAKVKASDDEANDNGVGDGEFKASDDVKPATKGSDEEPRAFKVGDYVVHKAGARMVMRILGCTQGIGFNRVWSEEVERGHRYRYLRSQLKLWTPEPGDVVKLSTSAIPEWTVDEVSAVAGKVLVSLAGKSDTEGWVEPHLLTPIR